MIQAGTTGIFGSNSLKFFNQNTALFSLLGTNYGGNGINNFALPDLRPAAPKNTVYYICVAGVFPQRAMGGVRSISRDVNSSRPCLRTLRLPDPTRLQPAGGSDQEHREVSGVIC